MGTAASTFQENSSPVVFTALLGGTLFKLAFLEFLRIQKRRQFVEVGEVAAIYLYPVKSTQGWSLQSADCTPVGVRYDGVTDRHFLITKPDRTFMSMRQEPSMSVISTTVSGDYMSFNAPGMETLQIPKHQSLNGSNLINCRIWDDKVDVVDCGLKASEWLSRYLKKTGLRLVYYPQEAPKRDAQDQKKPWQHKAQPGDKLAFAEYAAYTFGSADSLDALNQNLSSSISIRNFRPNIVVSGSGAFQEETWNEILIGKASFRSLDLCARCLATTIDPESGVKHPDQEPFNTLKKFHSYPSYANKPIFGFNASLDNPGRIRVGDKVYALIE